MPNLVPINAQKRRLIPISDIIGEANTMPKAIPINCHDKYDEEEEEVKAALVASKMPNLIPINKIIGEANTDHNNKKMPQSIAGEMRARLVPISAYEENEENAQDLGEPVLPPLEDLFT